MSINLIKKNDSRYEKIRTALVEYLGREPHEHEIINAQNDHSIMTKVLDQETKESQAIIEESIDSKITEAKISL